MNSKDLEINKLIMKEIGLEIGQYNRIVDPDTAIELSLKGQSIVAPGAYCGHNTIEFDPYNNRKMMGQLFGYFANKIAGEYGVEILSFYNINENNTTKGKLECKLSDNSIITSKEYKRDSLKYLDIILQLNGTDCNDIDLSEYDLDIKKAGKK